MCRFDATKSGRPVKNTSKRPNLRQLSEASPMSPSSKPSAPRETLLDGGRAAAEQGLGAQIEADHCGPPRKAGESVGKLTGAGLGGGEASGGVPQELRGGFLGEGEAIGLFPESFDHVLLDAPCSGLGLRPRLQQGATLEGLRECGAYQRVLISAAVPLLKPGGSLVYSTCTINPGESPPLPCFAGGLWRG